MKATNANGWRCSECETEVTEAELCDRCGAVLCAKCAAASHRRPARMPTDVERRNGEWAPRYDGTPCGPPA